MVPWVLMHINTTLFLLVRNLAQMMAFPLREVCLFAKVAISDPVIANIVTMLLETFFGGGGGVGVAHFFFHGKSQSDQSPNTNN